MIKTQLVEVNKSKKHGQGLFVLKAVKKGDRLYRLKQGKIISYSEVKDLSESEKNHLDRVGDDKYEIIAPPGCYINHSCEPNTVEKNHFGYALRDISAGEEITIDYDRVAYLEKPFICRCGSKNCRQHVSGKDHMTNQQTFNLAKKFLGKKVEVVIDRPLGSKHPDYDLIYQLNYGYVPGTRAADEEELDAYVLGLSSPVKKAQGKCIAIIHRLDDDDDKLVVNCAPDRVSDEEISQAVDFQESWFKYEIIRKKK